MPRQPASREQRCQQRYDEQRQEDVEENFGDSRSGGSNAAEAEDGRDKRDDEKRYSPSQKTHDRYPLKKTKHFVLLKSILSGLLLDRFTRPFNVPAGAFGGSTTAQRKSDSEHYDDQACNYL